MSVINPEDAAHASLMLFEWLSEFRLKLVGVAISPDEARVMPTASMSLARLRPKRNPPVSRGNFEYKSDFMELIIRRGTNRRVIYTVAREQAGQASIRLGDAGFTILVFV